MLRLFFGKSIFVRKKIVPAEHSSATVRDSKHSFALIMQSYTVQHVIRDIRRPQGMRRPQGKKPLSLRQSGNAHTCSIFFPVISEVRSRLFGLALLKLSRTITCRVCRTIGVQTRAKDRNSSEALGQTHGPTTASKYQTEQRTTTGSEDGLQKTCHAVCRRKPGRNKNWEIVRKRLSMPITPEAARGHTKRYNSEACEDSESVSHRQGPHGLHRTLHWTEKKGILKILSQKPEP